MAEQFANFSAATTVAIGGYTSGSGVLNVASTAAPFPSLATFTVLITDAATDVAKVLLRVTAVNSATQWAVTAEGTDASASASDKVYLVLSAAGINQMRADLATSGTYASLPSSPTNGDEYLCTDVPLRLTHIGGAWVAQWRGQLVTLPTAASGWTAINGGSIADDKGCLLITSGVGVNNWQPFTRNAPATPYTIEVGLSLNIIRGRSSGAGLCFSDGTKYKYWFAADALGVQYNTTVTAFSATNFTLASPAGQGYDQQFFLKISDDGANRRYYVSANGVDWYQAYSEASNTNFTATKVGFVLLQQNSDPLTARIFHYKVS